MPPLTFPIHTARLKLRPFTEDNFGALYAMQSRPDVTRYLYWDPRTEEEVRTSLAERRQTVHWEAQGDKLSLAVERWDTGAFVGDVMLYYSSQEHRTAEIGFVLHPDHYGQGFAAEASRELLRLGFEVFGLHRIVGRCDGRNAASARVMEKLGMRREAAFLRNEFVKGEWTDELVYALLAEEWTGSRKESEG